PSDGPMFLTIDSHVWSMNWSSPDAVEVPAPAAELRPDSICAVVSRYSKLVPVVSAACLIAPATCVGGIALTVAAAMAPGLPALLGCPARAALGSIDSYGKRNLNGRRSRPLRGRDCNAGHRPAAQARRPLFRG